MMSIGTAIVNLKLGHFLRRQAWGQAGAYIKLEDGIVVYKVLGKSHGPWHAESSDVLGEDWELFVFDETPVEEKEPESSKEPTNPQE